MKALIHISQAGCGTSMIFLAFTIVLYTCPEVGSPRPSPTPSRKETHLPAPGDSSRAG